MTDNILPDPQAILQKIVDGHTERRVGNGEMPAFECQFCERRPAVTIHYPVWDLHLCAEHAEDRQKRLAAMESGELAFVCSNCGTPRDLSSEGHSDCFDTVGDWELRFYGTRCCNSRFMGSTGMLYLGENPDREAMEP